MAVIPYRRAVIPASSFGTSEFPLITALAKSSTWGLWLLLEGDTCVKCYIVSLTLCASNERSYPCDQSHPLHHCDSRRVVPPLRIGIAVSSADIPRWVARVLDAIEASERLDLALVVYLHPAQDPWWVRSVWALRSAVFRAWSSWDRHHFVRSGDDALRRVSLTSVLADTVPRGHVPYPGLG